MSREQWGHGYWKGVEDAQIGNIRLPIDDEVKLWIATMCRFNSKSHYDRSLFPVSSFISFVYFCGMDEKYAKKIYNYILNHNYYEFKPNEPACCYVTGSWRNDWAKDYFVIPVHQYSYDEWTNIAIQISKKES